MSSNRVSQYGSQSASLSPLEIGAVMLEHRDKNDYVQAGSKLLNDTLARPDIRILDHERQAINDFINQVLSSTEADLVRLLERFPSARIPFQRRELGRAFERRAA